MFSSFWYFFWKIIKYSDFFLKSIYRQVIYRDSGLREEKKTFFTLKEKNSLSHLLIVCDKIFFVTLSHCVLKINSPLFDTYWAEKYQKVSKSAKKCPKVSKKGILFLKNSGSAWQGINFLNTVWKCNKDFFKHSDSVWMIFLLLNNVTWCDFKK